MDKNEFRAALKAAHLTQKALAALLGRGQATVQRWAQGETSIPPEVAVLMRLMANGRLRPEEVAAARLGLDREDAALAMRLATALTPRRGHLFEWLNVEPLDEQAARLLEAAKVVPERRPMTRPPVMWWVVRGRDKVIAAGDGQLAAKSFLNAVAEVRGGLDGVQLIMDAGEDVPAWRLSPVRSALISAVEGTQNGGFRLHLDGGSLLMAPVAPAEARRKAMDVLGRILAWLPPDAPETVWLTDVLTAPHKLMEEDEAEIHSAAKRIERMLTDHPPPDDSLPGAAATAALWALHGHMPLGSTSFALALEEAAAS